MLVAADVGNSGVKLGAFDGSKLVRTARVSHGGAKTPAEALSLAPSDLEVIVCISVLDAALEAFLASCSGKVVVLGRDLPMAIENRYARPAEVGHDRLANAAAAHARAGGAALAVDLGSAATLDAVAEDGAFLGGAIAPGLGALACGLAGAAPALPPYDGEPPPDTLPRSTSEAIRQGVLVGFAGLVDRLIEESAPARHGRPVYLTGGDAERVAPHLRAPSGIVPHLTLEGVRVLYDRVRRS